MGKKAQCRIDWHQTGSYVVVSIFAKKYLPSQSAVKLNPIHLTVDLFFIEEDSRYNLDIELKGVCINFNFKCVANGTKSVFTILFYSF